MWRPHAIFVTSTFGPAISLPRTLSLSTTPLASPPSSRAFYEFGSPVWLPQHPQSAFIVSSLSHAFINIEFVTTISIFPAVRRYHVSHTIDKLLAAKCKSYGRICGYSSADGGHDGQSGR